MGCLSEDDLLEYVEGRVAPEALASFEAHLRACDACRRAIAELARPTSAPPDRDGDLDRYEIAGAIGAGAMGVVYAARDRKLGRVVALKMLRASTDGAPDDRERLLREARALARLSHPNVIAVYDVGALGDHVFVSMEFVEGVDAKTWLAQQARSWREIVEVFLSAARGLAAAHEAGLVHRDFKPDNVLVGADGRARVTDFGLARALADASPARGAGDRADASASAVAGSPAYMSPEQLRGEPADARSDVFSFSVALHEAIHGARPFDGASPADLEPAIRRGEIRAGRATRVPAWLRRTIARGLRYAPEERFEAMQTVAGALERGLAGARRRRRTAAIVLASVVAAALLVFRPQGPPAPAAGIAIRSLAVLPLEDLSREAGPPSFADTVTEALTTELARTRGLWVTSRRAANAADASAPPARVGRALNVDAVLHGTVRRAAGKVRLELRIVRTSDGAQIWAAAFDGPLPERFVVEDEAARAVRATLAPWAGGSAPAAASAVRNAEAFELYLRGKIHLRRQNEADDAEAIRLLERAVALDRDDAAAHAELARAYGLRASQFAPGDRDAVERAQVAAEEALRLDPDLAEAHLATAYLMWEVLPDRFIHERAVQELKRALASNPNLAEAHHQLGTIYLHVGLLEQAREELQRTLLLDPTDANAIRRLALLGVFRGEYAEALAALRQVPQRSNPSYWSYDVAWTLQYLGRTEEARGLIEEYLRIHPEDHGGLVTSARAMLFARAGDARRARRDIRDALRRGAGYVHFHHTTYNVASAYALLGDPRRAVRWLRVTADTGWPCYPLFATDPNLARIRADPAFAAFLAELKARWERYRATL